MRPGVRLPALAALACLAGVFALVIVAYAPGPFAALDGQAVNALRALEGPLATPVLNLVAHTGDPVPLGLMLAAVVLGGLALGRRRQAVTAAAAVVGANVATQLLKLALAHPRVYPVLGTHQLDSTAFPSGHATASMSIALAAVMVCPPAYRRWAGPLAAGYAIAVATAILVLAWHFPSDVFGGFLVAAGFAFGSLAVSRELAGREAVPRAVPAPHGPPPAALALAAVATATALALARYSDLVGYARDHTTGVAALVGVVSACALLMTGAGRLADR